MDLGSPTPRPAPTPPWEDLRCRLLERAEAIDAAGDAAGAAVLRALVDTWWREQREWNAAAREALRASHDINNALVGVSGQAQLLLMAPVGQQPAVRERLRMVLQEVDRIERATRNLQELKAAFLECAAGESHGEPSALPL